MKICTIIAEKSAKAIPVKATQSGHNHQKSAFFISTF